MVKITALILVCCLWCISLYAEDSDTTYGRIRIKDRPPSSGERSSGESDDEGFFGSCVNSCLGGICNGCLDFIFNDAHDAGQLHEVPPQRPPTEAQAETVYPKETYVSFSDAPFHLTCGMLTGVNSYSDGIAVGFVIGGTMEVYYFIHPYLGLRLAAQPSAAFDSLSCDMEKKVFVNDSLIGYTTFTGERGREFILPLKAEVLFVPPVGERTFFISVGGGMSYKREWITGTRIKTFSKGAVDETVDFTQWCPNVHTGLGFIVPVAGIRGVLELGYSLFVNSDHGHYETPGDNTLCSHLVRLSFSFSIR